MLATRCLEQAGDVIFISGAASAVGSVAGQLAKLRGCRVIGSDGSAEKVRFLREECGFDSCVSSKLRQAGSRAQQVVWGAQRQSRLLRCLYPRSPFQRRVANGQQHPRQGNLRTPQNFDERTEVASSCVRNLGIKIPAIVDDMNNSTERAYTGWPDRIYLIEREGRIALKTRPGPFGFDPSQLTAHLQHIAHRTS